MNSSRGEYGLCLHSLEAATSPSMVFVPPVRSHPFLSSQMIQIPAIPTLTLVKRLVVLDKCLRALGSEQIRARTPKWPPVFTALLIFSPPPTLCSRHPLHRVDRDAAQQYLQLISRKDREAAIQRQRVMELEKALQEVRR
jgi:hypothetical protein